MNGRLDWSALRDEVVAIVKREGHLRLAEPIPLASGLASCDFIDVKKALKSGINLRLACEAMIGLLENEGIEFDAVGGLTMGADQFAHGIAVLAGCDWFVVRKESKGRGTDRLVEGADLSGGVKVVLLDDVVTTGGSIEFAYEIVRRHGARVVGAVTLVDRGDRAAQFFAERGIPYRCVVSYADLGIEAV